MASVRGGREGLLRVLGRARLDVSGGESGSACRSGCRGLITEYICPGLRMKYAERMTIGMGCKGEGGGSGGDGSGMAGGKGGGSGSGDEDGCGGDGVVCGMG